MSPAPAPQVVLMVEDPYICTYVRNVLARRGFEFLQKDVRASLDVLGKQDLKVSVLITNRPEPFLPYAEQLPVLYMAAFPDPDLASRFRFCRPLIKPFRPEQLLAAIDDLAGPL